MVNINIEKIERDEFKEASGMLGKAFATQPSSFAIYKGVTDIELLSKRMALIFEALLKSPSGRVFVAKYDGKITGAMRIVEWPQCQLSTAQRLRMLPLLVRSGGGFPSLRRSMEFRGAWAKNDPKKPHYHLDPLGIHPDLQGKGIGSKMMEYYCNIVDSKKMDAYHETDRTENVGFYEKFGFEVIKEEEILGFPNWYMWRSSNSK